MKRGDSEQVPCPKCKVNIGKPTGNRRIESVVEFELRCPACDTLLYCWARPMILVEVEIASRVP